MATLKRNQIATFIKAIPHGRFVGIEFVKADGSQRTAQVAFGVYNPSHATKPGQGQRQGVSFDEALSNGVVKFFEANKDNGDGTRGNYRSARIDRIKSITFGQRYDIID